MDKNKWLQDNGFNQNEITYCIIGNTYVNKEYLKQQNCKYSPLLKWHCDQKIKVPQNCSIVEIHFSQIYQWNEKLEKPLLFENAESWLQSTLNPHSRAYKFLGNIGQRIYDIAVKYKSSYSFVSRYGQFTYIHTFETDENKIIWFTTKEIKYKLDECLSLTGTIVQHQNYKGDNTTIVNRCVLK